MKYFSKIFITLFILVFAGVGLCNIAYAENTTQSEVTQSTQSATVNPLPKSEYGAENEILSAPNVINIILISVGIVLILLAIAILTRLKK